MPDREIRGLAGAGCGLFVVTPALAGLAAGIAWVFQHHGPVAGAAAIGATAGIAVTFYLWAALSA